MQHTLTILLQNEAGALVRVAGLFAARGYNIDALNVVVTDDPQVSRLTLVVQCEALAVAQILHQARKLIDVLDARELAGVAPSLATAT